MQNEISKFKAHLNITGIIINDDSYVDNIRKAVRAKDTEALNEMRKCGIIGREYAISNLVAYVGIQEIMRYLADQDVNSGGVNYGALGDGTPNPLTSSTVLDNEVYRKVKASAAYADNFVYIDFFYEKTDVSGTFTEFGTFINSTSTPDDPFLFSYIATGGWVKSALESLFVSCEYNITNA